MTKCRRFKPRDRCGTTLVESAVVLPVFLTFIFAIIEFSHAQLVNNMLNNACRTAARIGSVEGTSSSDVVARIDISHNPITNDYATIDTIERRHQAGDYSGWTGMGDGILKARELMVGDADDPDDEGYTRYGAHPTMLIMTDGQTNQGPSGWSKPGGFSWNDWTDYDGDGVADYSTSEWKKQYAFWEATQAIQRGITLHTMAVGAGADRSLMEAIAFSGGGICINVPGGATVAEMESQLLEAFSNIASQVPPAKLVYEMDAGSNGSQVVTSPSPLW